MDLDVIILTWIKTFGRWRQLRQLQIKASVTDVLIRDGRYKGNLLFLLIAAPRVITYRFMECHLRYTVLHVSCSL